jgi:hypothetical protein
VEAIGRSFALALAEAALPGLAADEFATLPEAAPR